MTIKKMYCSECGIAVEGNFRSGIFSSLDRETLDFIFLFLKAEGSIKDLERELGVSYPTVKARISDMVQKVKLLDDERAAGEKEARKKEKEKSGAEEKVRSLYKKF